jgi:hypothetical protein
MNITAQVISIAVAIAILAFIAYWMLLRPRDKEDGRALGKKGRKSNPRSRRDARQKETTTGKSNQAAQDILQAVKENPPGDEPEKDREASSPELKETTHQEDTVYTITLPGKNGRPKH